MPVHDYIHIHTGAIVCGMVTETNPIHVVAGDAFHHGLLLSSLEFPHDIVLSEEFKSKLDFFDTGETYSVKKLSSPVFLKV